MLGNLKSEVNAVGFYRTDQPGKRVARTFQAIRRYSNGKFT